MGNDLPDYQTEVSTTLDLPYLPLTGGTMTGNIAMGTKKVTGLGAPSDGNDAARKSEVDAVSALLDDVSQTDVTASRAVDGTVYQNTGSKVRVVLISVLNNSAGTAIRDLACSCENANPPTILVAQARIQDVNFAGASSWSAVVTFIVPPTWRYKAAGTNVTLNRWIEYDLH